MNGFIKIKPVPKGRPKFGNKFAFTPKKTREYEKTLKDELSKIVTSSSLTPFECPIHVELSFFVIKPKKPSNPYPVGDIDNYVKSFFDAANGVLFFDDKQVCSLSAKKSYVNENEGIFFQINSYDFK
jgi:Holliday junction resolvase RusA-like endonuclease